MILAVGAVELFYEKQGKGRPLILLHGNGEDHHIFDGSVDALAKEWTVYRPDSRGHGQSSPVREFHYQDMAEDIISMIEELQLVRPCLYGFSDGGIIGLLIAAQRPDLLSGLIISGANLNPKGLKRFPLWMYRAAWFFSRSPKLRLMLTEPNLSQEDLARISVPVWVTAGQRDVIRKEHTKRIAEERTANCAGRKPQLLCSPRQYVSAYYSGRSLLCEAARNSTLAKIRPWGS